MKIFGFEITRPAEKAVPIPLSPAWQPGWFPIVHEPYTGAWQKNQELMTTGITSYYAVFACLTLIASDISKLRVKFIREADGVWQEDKSAAYDPVLRRPNKMQNSIQFWESWMLSKLQWGNTYVLKGRDKRRVVDQLYVLDPSRVKAKVTDFGDVYYDIQVDNISGVREQVLAPASEIIHDRMNCFYHPLCGVPPLWAAALAATQGLAIQKNSTTFFDNRSIPGGVLSAPGRIAETTVNNLRDQWNQNFSGRNTGKVAILGDGMKYEPMAVTAHDAQMLEQSKATAEWVCSAFHVPPYKIGVGPLPSYNNVQALNVEYYSQCLQTLIESAEVCLDQGLEMGSTVGVEFDLDGLLRMDTVSQISSLKEAMSAGLIAPNEGRKRLGYGPVPGGGSPMAQQQMFSLAALAERDKSKPFAKPEPAPMAAPASPPPQEENNDDGDDGGPRKNGQQKLPKSNALSLDVSDLLPEAMTAAFADLIADAQREWRRDSEQYRAETRATIAELRNEVLVLKAELNEQAKAWLAVLESRFLARLADIKDGEQGIPGPAGEAVRGEKGDPGIAGPQGEKGADGAPGPRGAGVAGAFIDSDGCLRLTWDDGIAELVGVVKGLDGKDGAAGKDGRDGLGIEDITLEYDGERELTFRFMRGDTCVTKTLYIGIPLDHGVFKADTQYRKGDLVTYAGSMWIAQKDGPEGKPDESNGAWRLCVKRGRDGRDK